jgi:hypothetical protein
MKLSTLASRGTLCALALVHLTCHQAILTAQPGATLTLIVNPLFIPAHGGVAVVSAVVIEEIGTPVPDGTVVQFLTSLGRIDEQGKTNDGVARVNLISDSRSGQATVTAFSGVASDTETVDIGSVRPEVVIVTADPPFIPSNSRTTHIFANVLDEFGNPVSGVFVIFRVTSPTTGTEFMESGGNPIPTDNNGRAEDILRTRRPFGTVGPPAVVSVTVLAPNVPTNPAPSVTVPIQ